MALRHMLNLIDDIVKHGTNPADLPIVVPDPDESDKYQVMEGNRRIASLKLLYFPELAAEVFQAEPRVLKRLEEFRKDFLAQFQEQYKKVLCVVFSTPKDANHWIYLRHTGENEGRGITPWDKMAKDHFRLQISAPKHTIATQIVEILAEKGYIRSDLPVVLSTLERMVKDPDVAARLHIRIEEGEVRLPQDPQLQELALMALRRIALDTVDKDPYTKRNRLTSRHINQKQERIRYLNQVLTQISIPNPEPFSEDEGNMLPMTQSTRPDSSESEKQKALLSVPTPLSTISSVIPTIPSRPSATQDHKKRRQVAAKGIRIQYSTLNHLYQELCRLDAESYPNVGIMGIRVFLEGSLDVFMQRFASEAEFKDLMQNSKAPFKIAVTTKLSRVVDYLERLNALPVDVAQALRKYQTDKNNPLSIDTLQAYLHNPVLEPHGDTAKYWWDAYHPLFEALWNTYNNAQG